MSKRERKTRNLQGGKPIDSVLRGSEEGVRIRGKREAIEMVPFDDVEPSFALGDRAQPQRLRLDRLGARLARRPIRLRVLRHYRRTRHARQ